MFSTCSLYRVEMKDRLPNLRLGSLNFLSQGFCLLKLESMWKNLRDDFYSFQCLFSHNLVESNFGTKAVKKLENEQKVVSESKAKGDKINLIKCQMYYKIKIF